MRNFIRQQNKEKETRWKKQSLGSAGNERKITNVATGIADTDVANTKQVNDAKSEAISTANAYTDTKSITTLNQANTYTDTAIANYDAGIDNKIANSENRMKDYTDSKINSLEQSLTKEYRSATATVIALGVSPILANGNKNALGVGYGNYEGEQALAVNYIAEVKSNVHFQTGASLNSNSRGVKAGVSLGF